MNKAIQANYKEWGLGSSPKIITSNIDQKNIRKSIIVIEKIFPLRGLHFSSAILVNYFQGDDVLDNELLLLRFDISNEKKHELLEEHVSILINPIDHKIFGIMDLRCTASK